MRAFNTGRSAFELPAEPVSPSSALISLLSAAPAGPTWVKANTNTIQEVFPPPGYMASYNGTTIGSSYASAVIRCWSGMAIDTNRAQIDLYGGGHANYDGNEFYVFDMLTRKWRLGYYPTDVQLVQSPNEYKTIDGDTHSPVSSHTYGNNQFLPVLDKFLTFGGAAAHTGGALAIRDSGAPRLVGCFTLDVSQAAMGKVGGVAGSNVKHGHSVSLPGANAWQVRDWLLDHSAASTMLNNGAWAHQSTGAAYRAEFGKDVLYKYSKVNGYFWRIQFNDADYHNDTITLLGTNVGNEGWDCAPTINAAGTFLALGGAQYRIHGWSVGAVGSGATPTFFGVPASGINTSAEKTTWMNDPYTYQWGVIWDPLNSQFVIWNGDSRLFSLTHGGGSLNSNWNLATVLAAGLGTAGVTRPYARGEAGMGNTDSNQSGDTSTLGKWKWAPNLNCGVGLQHARNGDVWLFKPANWVAP